MGNLSATDQVVSITTNPTETYYARKRNNPGSTIILLPEEIITMDMNDSKEPGLSKHDNFIIIMKKIST